jgi:hypothetical protein
VTVRPLPSCPPEEVLEEYVSSAEGSPQDTAELQAHIRTCERCRQALAQMQEDRELLESVGHVLQREAKDKKVRQAGSSGNTDEAGRAAAYPILPPETIQGYRILEELGRGGMGVVYRAVQLSTKRTVALKVMLDGPFASVTSRRRFEREVELAASLSHPGIVTIHDSGLCHGRYYFAMDLIEGQRLDRFVRDRPLAVRERLALVGRICEAVQYAHQRGVIHRDLKPSNILVDDRGQPHVLDFGLAKTLGTEHADSAQVTLLGHTPGTPAYMAPEQTEGSVVDVDTRTDVYALGVILYELLTDRPPYTVKGPASEVMRNIRQAEPARLRAFVRDLDRDVETIALKALAKDKGQRYQSAGDLAADINHYLSGEAIGARQTGAAHLLWKAIRRHRRLLSLLGLGLLLAVSVAAGVAWRVRATDHANLLQRILGLKVQATASMTAEDYQVAEDLYTSVLALDASDAEAKEGLARARQGFDIQSTGTTARKYLAEGRFDVALGAGLNSLKRYPDDAVLKHLVREAKGTATLTLKFDLGTVAKATLRAISENRSTEDKECDLPLLLGAGIDIEPGWHWLTVSYQSARGETGIQQVRYLLRVSRGRPYALHARRVVVGQADSSDFTDLGAALQVAEPGNTLELLPGEYDAAGCKRIPPNLTIVSADRANPATVVLEAPTRVVGLWDIQLRNLRFRGRPVKVADDVQGHILFERSVACKVLDCVFAGVVCQNQKSGWEGIVAVHAEGCDGIELMGNLFDNVPQHFVQFSNCRRTVLRGNRSNRKQGQYWSFQFEGAEGLLVLDNDLESRSTLGMEVSRSQDVWIAGNTTHEHREGALRLRDADALVAFNDFGFRPETLANYSLRLFGNRSAKILHNRLSGAKAGMQLVTSYGTTFARNLIDGAESGVVFAEGSGNVIRQNIFYSNKVVFSGEAPVWSMANIEENLLDREIDENKVGRTELIPVGNRVASFQLDGTPSDNGFLVIRGRDGIVWGEPDAFRYGPQWGARAGYVRWANHVADQMLEFVPSGNRWEAGMGIDDLTRRSALDLAANVAQMGPPRTEGLAELDSLGTGVRPVSYKACESMVFPCWDRTQETHLHWQPGSDNEAHASLSLEVSRFGRVLWRRGGLSRDTLVIPANLPGVRGPHYEVRLCCEDTGQTLSVVNPVDFKRDEDGDGLDDEWELEHFRTLEQSGGGDPDGDGASNICEYYGMTDPAAFTLYASDMKEIRKEVGYGRIEYNGCGEWDGKIHMAGVIWDKSLAVHASSLVDYEVPNGFNAVRVLASTWDRNGASVRFECHVNDGVVWQSGEYGQYSCPAFVEVSVRAGDRLKLIVDSLGDINRDHSCWLQPAFVNTLNDPLE